jgi:hypothetical protein
LSFAPERFLQDTLRLDRASEQGEYSQQNLVVYCKGTLPIVTFSTISAFRTDGHASNFVVLLGLMLLTIAVYAGALQGSFVSDDLAFIVNNAGNFGDAAKITSYFSAGVWNHANEPHADASLYRPIWLVWNNLIYHIAGEQPLYWHISSLILHALNGFLVYLLVGQLFLAGGQLARVLSAVLFLVHPVATQTVAWISASTDLLLCMFLLSSLLAYISYQKTKSITWYVGSLLLFAVAVLTKEPALAMLPTLVVYDWWRNMNIKSLPWKLYLGFIMVAVLYLITRSVVLKGVLDGASPWQFTFDDIYRCVEYAATYSRILVLPYSIPFTMRHVPGGLASWFDIMVGVSIIVSALILFVRQSTSRLALTIIFVPMTVPVLLAFHPLGLFAARILYVPLAGLALLAAPVVDKHIQSLSGRGVVLSVVILLCTITITVNIPHWRDYKHWSNYVLKYDESYAAGWVELAKYHLKRKEAGIAIEIYQRALNNIDDPDDEVMIREHLGLLYADQGQFEQSLIQYRQIANNIKYSHIGWTGVGNSLWMLKRNEEALSAYRNAMQSNPNYVDAILNYALLSENTKQMDQAAWAYRKLLTLPLKPDQISAARRAQKFLRRYESQSHGR